MFFLNEFFWKARKVGSSWGPAQWTAFTLALLALTLIGLCLHHTPRYEVVYSSRWVAMPADKGRTSVLCTVEVGNTGRRPQDNVKIHFAKTAIDHVILQPTVKSFGVIDRPFWIRTSGMRTTISLGRLDPEKRVTVSFLLSYTAFENTPTWSSAFKGVEPARGKSKIGDPGLIMTNRGFFAGFAQFLPF